MKKSNKNGIYSSICLQLQDMEFMLIKHQMLCLIWLCVNVDALAAYEGGGSPCGGPKDATGCRSENTINCKDTSGCQ